MTAQISLDMIREAAMEMQRHEVPSPYYVMLPSSLGKELLAWALEDGLRVERVPSAEAEGYDELAGLQMDVDGRTVRVLVQDSLPEQ